MFLRQTQHAILGGELAAQGTLDGQVLLDPVRARELQEQMLAAGLPSEKL